jgi:paraquat-inducible protein A
MNKSPQNSSLISQFPKQGMSINLLLLLTFGILSVGIFAPMLTLKYIVASFFVWDEKTVTLYSTISQLYESSEYFLFIVITLFSICFPIFKIFTLLFAVNINIQPHSFLDKSLKFVEIFGKWSMLEVFVVALLLVSVKLGALLNVQVHYGVYAFAVSVLLTLFISHWIEKLSLININYK